MNTNLAKVISEFDACKDLTKGYTFESPHATMLSAPTLFTTPKALRDSAMHLVELFRLQDYLRTQNKHPAGGHEQILGYIMEQHRVDGGIMRKPNAGDRAWAIAFDRPGSDIMQ